MKYLSKILKLHWLGDGRDDKTKSERLDEEISITKFDDDDSFYLLTIDWEADVVAEALEKSNFMDNWERHMDSGMMVLSGAMDDDIQPVKTTLGEVFEHGSEEDKGS